MRKPMVTRTIISTKVTALCVNPQTEKLFKQDFTLAGKIEDEAKALKKVSKEYNSDDCTIVSIRELLPIEALYGMNEADFIAGSKILDRATRKEIAEQADAETTKQADAE